MAVKGEQLLKGNGKLKGNGSYRGTALKGEREVKDGPEVNGESYRKQYRPFLLCLCDVFRALINALVC